MQASLEVSGALLPMPESGRRYGSTRRADSMTFTLGGGKT